MDQTFVPSKRRVRRLAAMLIADRQAYQQKNGDRYEHDFNDAGFIASLCRGFTRDPSSGNSEALLDGVPDLAV
jgi:hypothetical protein